MVQVHQFIALAGLHDTPVIPLLDQKRSGIVKAMERNLFESVLVRQAERNFLLIDEIPNPTDHDRTFTDSARNPFNRPRPNVADRKNPWMRSRVG